MKKPTKPQLYSEVARLQEEVANLKAELEQSREEVANLNAELEASREEISRLKTLLSKVWSSRSSARFWLKDAREEVGRMMSALLSKI